MSLLVNARAEIDKVRTRLSTPLLLKSLMTTAESGGFALIGSWQLCPYNCAARKKIKEDRAGDERQIRLLNRHDEFRFRFQISVETIHLPFDRPTADIADRLL